MIRRGRPYLEVRTEPASGEVETGARAGRWLEEQRDDDLVPERISPLLLARAEGDVVLRDIEDREDLPGGEFLQPQEVAMGPGSRLRFRALIRVHDPVPLA